MIFWRRWLFIYFVSKGGDTWRFWTIVYDYDCDYNDESWYLSIWFWPPVHGIVRLVWIDFDLVLAIGSWIRPVGSVLVWKLKLSLWIHFSLIFYMIPIFGICEKFNQLFEKLSLVVVVRVGYSLLGGYFEKLRLSLCYLTWDNGIIFWMFNWVNGTILWMFWDFGII